MQDNRIADSVPTAIPKASATLAHSNPEIIGHVDLPSAQTAKWKPEKGAPAIRKRDRKRASCNECKRRKIKCDLARPSCTRCTTSEQLCVYKAGRGKAGYVANTDRMIPSSLPLNSVACPNCSLAMTLVPAVIPPFEEIGDLELFNTYCNDV